MLQSTLSTSGNIEYKFVFLIISSFLIKKLRNGYRDMRLYAENVLEALI